MDLQDKNNRLAKWIGMDVDETTSHEIFPKDLVSKIEFRRALNAVTMKKADDPALLFEQISAIENKLTQ
jgi:hypothetical protein